MNLKSKLFASAVVLTMVLGVAIPASAQTAAELTAQINALLAQISQLQAQVGGGATTNASTSMFDKDLTVGSTGSNVVDLQRWLVNNQYLTMPVGTAYGYFGNLTKSAVARFQSAVGITPAVGYFGPKTMAKLNSMLATTGTVTTTTTAGCTAGALYSSTTGALCSTTTTTTGSTGSTGITTPGVEGTLSVTSNNSGLVSTVYAGDSMDAVLGFNIEAKQSDIAIQRIKLDLGTQTKFYNAIYNKLYVTDGSNVLASIDLNSSTVVKDGTHYYVTLTGFNYVVPKGVKKQIVVKADLHSSIDSLDYDTETYPIALANDGVRGIDGAGIDQYAGTTDITRTPTISGALSDSADLKVSLDNSSPLAQDVVASNGSGNNELDGLTLLTFNVKAEKDALTLQDLTVHLTYSTPGGTATATTVYLYDGSTQLDNASVSATSAVAASASFTDLGYVIPKDTTKTLTVKVDVRTATDAARTMLAYVAYGDFTVENTKGDSITDKTGSATGYAMSVRDAGVEISLVSKSITTNGVAQTASSPLSTSTLTATFNVSIKAVGNDVVLGTVASSTQPLFGYTGADNSFQLFRNGVATSDSLAGISATSTSFAIPSNCTTIAGKDSCTLAEGSQVTVPVTFMILGRSATAALTSGLYSVALTKVNWGYGGSSTFMNGDQNWRTADVSFP